MKKAKKTAKPFNCWFIYNEYDKPVCGPYYTKMDGIRAYAPSLRETVRRVTITEVIRAR